MIKELRVGNIYMDVCGVKNTWKASSFEHYKSVGCQISKLEPIPLTEDWLVKINEVKLTKGIKPYKNQFAGSLIINDNISLGFCRNTIDADSVDVFLTTKFNDKEGNAISIRLDIKYLHQLQNYYFFSKLTGEELTIKENKCNESERIKNR